MKTFCNYFLGLKNSLLVKSEGMIPFYLKKYYGYDAYITCYKNEEYFYLNNILKGLRINFLEKKYKYDFINTFIYLKNNAKKINVLMIYSMGLQSLYTSLFYKLFNKKGIVFVKLDAADFALNILTHNLSYFNSFKEKSRFFLAAFIIIFFLKHYINILNVETKKVYNILNEYNSIYGEKLLYTPYGIQVSRDIKITEKKNQILTVGRLGTYEKATEVLLEAFKLLKNNNGWVLKLAGPIDKNFENYIQNYFRDAPELKDSVIFLGNIPDREELFNLYNESKIFCLPSRSESFGIVLPEAAYFANYIISTPVGVAPDLLSRTNFGTFFEIDDVKSLANKIQFYMDNESKIIKDLNLSFDDLQNLVYSIYGYETICEEINQAIQKELCNN